MNLYSDRFAVAKTPPYQDDDQQQYYPLPDSMRQEQLQYLVHFTYEKNGKYHGGTDGQLGLLPPETGHQKKQDRTGSQQYRLQGFHISKLGEPVLPTDPLCFNKSDLSCASTPEYEQQRTYEDGGHRASPESQLTGF
jgi:hypothetical protein